MSGTYVTVIPLFIACGGVLAYFFGKLLPGNIRRLTGTFTAIWLLIAFSLFLSAGIQGGDSVIPAFAPLLHDSFIGIIIGLLATGLGALAAFATQGRIDPAGPVHLFYPLFLFTLAGAAAVGFSNDLFMLFVMVELSAIPSYALVAYNYQQDHRALSASVKYLIQGVTGTVTALMGVSLLYLVGHTLSIPALPLALAGADPLLPTIAALLIIIGYGVKLAIVPLHTWLPDAYVRAPGGVTAIMAGATKVSVLIALFLSLSALPGTIFIPPILALVISGLAVITMTAGNLLALNQTDIRRILAYSSIAQMGYILLGFGIGLQYNLALGFEAGIFYAIAYGVMKGGAFLAADSFTAAAGSPETARMKGLGARHPIMGVSFAIFIFGLIGVPATAGFLGKLLVFTAGMATVTLGGVALILIMALNSALSLGYYVPILSTLLFQGKDSRSPRDTRMAISASCAVVILAVVTVYLGLFPQGVFNWIVQASSVLFPGGMA